MAITSTASQPSSTRLSIACEPQSRASARVSVDIAHDLKTPLSRLNIRLIEAQECQTRGQDASAALSVALAQADQLNATFEALLRIARLEGGARQARFECVDLREIVAILHEIYGEVAKDADMSLTVAETTMGTAGVRGGRELLIQLAANLIENALSIALRVLTLKYPSKRAAIPWR